MIYTVSQIKDFLGKVTIKMRKHAYNKSAEIFDPQFNHLYNMNPDQISLLSEAKSIIEYLLKRIKK